MYIYFLLLILLFVVMLSHKRMAIRINEKRYNSTVVFAVVFFAILGFFGALREGVGADYWTYRNSLVDYKNGTFYSGLNYEWGFMMLLWLLSKVTVTGQILIIVTSLCTVAIFAFIFNRFSEDIRMSAFLFYSLYFYFISFNAIRQVLAVAICMIAIKYLKDRSLIKYMAVVAIGTGVHTSSFIMIPFYFLTSKKVIKLMYVLWIPAMLTIFIGWRCIYPLFLSVFTKYAVYANAGGGSAYLNILFMLLNLFLIRQSGVETAEDRSFLHIYEAACLMGIFFSLLSVLNGLLIRVSLFFYAYSLLSVPFCLKRQRGSDKQMLWFATIGCALLIFCKSILTGVAVNTSYQMYTG